MQKIIINPSYGGNNPGLVYQNFIEKDYNLEIGKQLVQELTELGLSAYLLRENDINQTNQQKINLINDIINSNDEGLVITFQIIDEDEFGANIVYALRDDDLLARDISNSLETIGQTINKFYQLRDPNNTNLDFYELIREPNNTENIIISLGNPKNSADNIFLTNNIKKISQSIANAINNYLTSKNIYIVKRGDTLFTIANSFNITVDSLKEANNLTSNALIVGQELIIPKTKTNDSNDETMDMYLNYTVKSGDSLYKIANTYNTTVDILKDINNLTSNDLSINQIIKIPTSTTTTEEKYDNYTVKLGDSLYQIANTYNTTVDAIKNLNNLSNNNLKIGQVLKIPNIKGTNTQEETYSTYTVKPGDSLYQIAKSYNTTINGIINLNNLTSNNLTIGQTLKIPSSLNPIINNLESNPLTYTVLKGDSLYKIANLFKTSINAIKELNNLTSNNLAIGQVLKIPNNINQESILTYTVKSGDSLYRIANNFNTTVENIKKLNNLTSNNLAIGQVLKIN